MSKLQRVLAPIAVAGIAGLTGLVLVAPAGAAAPGTSYQATLDPVPLNTPSGAASGTAMVSINGDQATVTVKVSGLADKLPTDTKTLAAIGIPASFAGAPYPHVQHIHIGGTACPTGSADANGDGVISTVEGVPAYGKVGTTLSIKGSTAASEATNVLVAPSGGSYSYSRTFTLNSDTMTAIQDGKAAIVVHGLNPATAPKASLSTANSLGLTLVKGKPVALIATAPALCGVLHVSQMSTMPAGSSPTGGGSTAGIEDGWLFGLGGALIIAAGGLLFARRRFGQQS